MINRRSFIRGLGLAAVGTSIPILYGLTTQLSRRSLRLWGDGGPILRLAHLSDLHSSHTISLRHISASIDLILAQQPDLIAFTGDLVTRQAPDPDGLVRLLKRLSEAAPTLACLGNHDGGRWSGRHGGPRHPEAVVEMLETAGLRVLRDETERVEHQGRTLLVTGVQDLWSFPIDPARAGFQTESTPRIVLAHNPDTKDELAHVPWQLMLSGHTHGGQIRLPFVGGRWTAPVRDDRYIEGLLPWGERHLHISRGVGCLHGLRINCPPEVTLLELS